MNIVHRFDSAIVHAIQSIAVPGFGQLMVAATFMGNPIPYITISAIVAGTAVYQQAYRIAAAVTISVLLTGVYNLIKFLFNRHRPDTLYAAKLHTTSFPSGHAATSVAIYGLFGYLIATRLPTPYSYLGWVVGLLFPVLIGMSRVYLGAHYPSDVLGGWVLAAVGLFATIKLFKL